MYDKKATKNICHHLVPPSYHFCFVRFVYHITIIHFYVIILHPIHPRVICKSCRYIQLLFQHWTKLNLPCLGRKVRKIKMFDKFTVTICKKIPSLRFLLQSVWKKYTTYSDANGISRSRKVYSGTWAKWHNS